MEQATCRQKLTGNVRLGDRCARPAGHRGPHRSMAGTGPVPDMRRDAAPDLAWLDDAACTSADPELFFPERGGKDTSRHARRICAACPVTAQCLAWAQVHRFTDGIFGGLTERERRGLQNRQAAGVPAKPERLHYDVGGSSRCGHGRAGHLTADRARVSCERCIRYLGIGVPA